MQKQKMHNKKRDKTDNKEKKMEYQIGDIVRTKKVHPCGSKLWEVTRIGVDFKLKCQGCGHVVILPREKALKVITKLEKRKEQQNKSEIKGMI